MPTKRETESRPRPGRRCLVMALLGALTAGPVWSQDAADFFRANCFNCHTIGGGRLTGPDLKNVTARQKRDWLKRFIVNPKAVIDSGDPYARKLVDEARGALMARVSGITPEIADKLLDLIEEESKLESSQFVGLQLTGEFTPEDTAHGKALFLGKAKLASGGPPCVTCHTTGSVGGLGGGRLGPDLTRVTERLGGVEALAAWLLSPPSTTMQPIYKRHPLKSDEVLPLVAFLKAEAVRGGEADYVGRLNFLLLGLAASGLGLLAFDVIWKGRFRAVRRPLVRRINSAR